MKIEFNYQKKVFNFTVEDDDILDLKNELEHTLTRNIYRAPLLRQIYDYLEGEKE